MTTTDRRFIRPGVERITTDRYGRWYEWHGDRYWSVTTMLSQALSKYGLGIWRSNLVATTAIEDRTAVTQMLAEGLEDEAYDWLRKAPDRYAEKRAELGTQLHDYAEAHVLGAPKPPAIGELAELYEQFQAWLDAWQPRFLMAEAPVFNEKQKYAGTLDAIVQIPADALSMDALGIMWGVSPLAAHDARERFRDTFGDSLNLLVDYKTGKSVYPDVALQLAAYRWAEWVGMPDGSRGDLPRIDGAAVVHLRASTYCSKCEGFGLATVGEAEESGEPDQPCSDCDGSGRTPGFWSFYPVRTDSEVRRSFLYAREMYRWHRDIAKSVLGEPMEVPA